MCPDRSLPLLLALAGLLLALLSRWAPGADVPPPQLHVITIGIDGKAGDAARQAREVHDIFRRLPGPPVKALLMTDRGAPASATIQRIRQNDLYPDAGSLDWAFQTWFRPAGDNLVLLVVNGIATGAPDGFALVPADSPRGAAAQPPLLLEKALEALFRKPEAKVRVLCLLDTVLRDPAQDDGTEAGRSLRRIADRWPNVTILATGRDAPCGALAAGFGRELSRLGAPMSVPALLRALRRTPDLAGDRLRVFGVVPPDLALRAAPDATRTAPTPELIVQRGHFEQVNALLPTADCRRLISAGSDSTVRVWDRQEEMLLHVLPDHLNGVTAIALSRDERRIVTGDGRGTLRAWDALDRSGIEFKIPRGDGELPVPIQAVGILPDGSRCAALTDGRLWLCDLKPGAVPRPIGTGSADDPPTFRKLAVAARPGGAALAACDAENRVHLFDADGRRVPVEGDAPGPDRLVSFALSEDGTRLALGGARGTLVVREVAPTPDGGLSVKALDPIRYDGGARIGALAFSPTGLLAVAEGSTIHLRPARPTEAALDLPRADRGEVRTLVFSEDSRRLAALGGGPLAEVWSLPDGKAEARRIDLQFDDRARADAPLPTCAAFAPDGRELLVGDQRGAIRAWSMPDGRAVDHPAFRASGGQISHLSAAQGPHGGQLMLQVTRDGTARVWDIRAGRDSIALDALDGGWWAGEFLPDGSGLVLASRRDGRLKVVDIDGGARELAFAPPRSAAGPKDTTWPFETVAVSPDGRLVASSSPHGPLACVWELATGKLVKTIRGHRDGINSVSFSGDSRLLLTGGKDRAAKVWTLDGPDELLIEPTFTAEGADEDEIASARFDPRVLDPALFVTGGSAPGRGRVVLWRVGRAEPVKLLTDLKGRVGALAFSPDGRWLFAASDVDREPILWDLVGSRRKVRVGRAHAHTERVNAIVNVPGTPLLATASDDATIRFWNLEDQELRGTLSTLADPTAWVVFTPNGVFDGSSPKPRKEVTWRLGGFLEVAPMERFYTDFFQPGLLARLARGETPTPAHGAEFGKFPPPPSPLVRIVSPKGGPTSELHATFEVEVTDQGGGIGALFVFQDNQRIAPRQAPRVQVDPTTWRYSFPIDLFKRTNTLSVRAQNLAGYDSKTETVAVTYTRPIPRAPRIYALAVGVSDYGDPSIDLRYANRDARAIDLVFKKFSNRKIYPGGGKVVALTDSEATREKILDEFRAMAGKTEPQDTIVVYFAGHGDIQDGHYQFFAHGTKVDAEGKVTTRTGLAIREITEYLYSPNSRAINRVIILDTCKSGQALKELSALKPGALTDASRFRGEMDEIARDSGQIMIMASGAAQNAQESTTLGHGLLTYALLAGVGAAEEGPLKDVRAPWSPPHDTLDAEAWITNAKRSVVSLLTNAEKGLFPKQDLKGWQKPEVHVDEYYEEHPLILFAKP